MPAIPAWLYSVIMLAIKIGSPYLISWIRSFEGSLPQAVKDIIDALLAAFKNPTVPNTVAKAKAVYQLKAYRHGVKF